MDDQAKAERKQKWVARQGAISAGEAYPLELFRALSGMNSWSLRKAKSNGLRVRKCGRQRFVLGSDFHSYLQSIDD